VFDVQNKYFGYNSMYMSDLPQNQVSVIILTHDEGLLLHKTLLSIEQLATSGHHSLPEFIIAAWQPDSTTNEYLAKSRFSLKIISETTQASSGMGSVLNTAVKTAKGQRILIVTAGDLLGGSWLESSMEAAIYVPEYSVALADGPVRINKTYFTENAAEDSLLLAYGPWRPLTYTATKEVLLASPFPEHYPNFQQTQQIFEAQLNQAGITRTIVPQSAVWTRQVISTDSTLSLSRMGQLVPGLDFHSIRAMSLSEAWNSFQLGTLPTAADSSSLTHRLRKVAGRHPATRKAARVAYHIAKNARHSIASKPMSAPVAPAQLPNWLVATWNNMPSVDKSTFMTPETTPSLLYSHAPDAAFWRTARAYKALVDQTRQNNYDYIFVVPWLIEGGGDAVTIRYANTLKQLKPSLRIAVIATENKASKWHDRLTGGIDFLDFGILTSQLNSVERDRVMEHFIVQSGVRAIHIISSMYGFDFVSGHAARIRESQRPIQVIGTFFSQSKDADGRIYGYSHSHAPKLYPANAIYTTDNQMTKQMWTEEYGFDPDRIFVHDQPVDIPSHPWKSRLSDGTFRVLWASRLSPEKQPQILAGIARLLQDLPFEIDMYGSNDDFDMPTLSRILPKNIHYQRAFKGFQDLPYREYDAFLYTSLFDGMPNIVLEAGAAGMPLVTSNVGGVPALVRNAQNGFLINDLTNPEPYAQALRQIYEDAAMAAQLGEVLRTDTIRTHSWSSYEADIKSFLNRLQP
jgi:glycosyltransferase involved in cell wall biosynthesis